MCENRKCSWGLIVKNAAIRLLKKMIDEKKTITSLEFKEELRDICNNYKRKYTIIQKDVSAFLMYQHQFANMSGYVVDIQTVSCGKAKGEKYIAYKPRESHDERMRRERHEENRLGNFT